MTANLIKNGSFEDGWTDRIEPGGGWTRTQVPLHWGLDLWKPGDVYRGETIKGYPECVHKFEAQLPAPEQPGGSDALILDGRVVYKIFSSGGGFAARLWQVIRNLTPGEDYDVTVPIRCHRHYNETDPWGVEANLTVPGGVHILNTDGLPHRQWVQLACVGTANSAGELLVQITVSAKWPVPVDFFLDAIAVTAVATSTPPPDWEPPTHTGTFTAKLPVVLTPHQKPAQWRWQAWPTHFKTIWQKYGSDGSEWGIDYKKYNQCYHCGVDVKSGNYGEVMAVADGTVQSVVNKQDGLGLYVQIRHSDRYWTVYAHLNDVVVSQGQAVKAGQVIAHSGWTGNTSGTEQHLHVGQVDWYSPDPCCHSKYVDPEPYYKHLLEAPEPPQDGPISARYELYHYLCGDGRAYRVRGNLGGDEVFHTVKKDGRFYQVKNRQWEELWLNGAFIYRGWDTSYGNGQMYRHIPINDPNGSPWVWAAMRVGDKCTTQKRVQFYDKDTCREINHVSNGNVTDTITLVSHHDVWRSPHGYEVKDCIMLRWEQGQEWYMYARGYGLVGWGDVPGNRWSAIVEDVERGEDMEKIRCP